MRTQLVIGSSVVIGAAHKQKKRRVQLVIGSSVVIGAARKQKKREHN